jgi:hypothetical protein
MFLKQKTPLMQLYDIFIKLQLLLGASWTGERPTWLHSFKMDPYVTGNKELGLEFFITVAANKFC